VAPFWTSSATRMTISTAPLASAARPVENSTDWSTIPTNMPATTAIGRRSMPAITAVASPNSRIAGPTKPDSGRPISGARRKIPMAESTPARHQTMVETRLTGMPSSEARAAFSAAARTAMPRSVNWKKAANAPMSAATTRIVTMWSPENTTMPKVNS
jgi:hypothetical protein